MPRRLSLSIDEAKGPELAEAEGPHFIQIARMDSPDPESQPDSDEQEAALAAMRRDWAEMRDEMMHWDKELLACDKRAEALRRMALLQRHRAKHRAILLAHPTDPAALELAATEKFLAGYLELDDAANEAEEVMLQAFAKRAEASQAAAVVMLARLEALESIPQEQLDAASEDGRAEFLGALQHLQENREALLGELPIELRREWEGRLRPE